MNTQEASFRLAAVVVAAGSGTRMGTNFPKQYALIEGKTMLEHSVSALLEEPRIEQLVIVISPSDLIGQQLKFTAPRVKIARVGGASRADSIRNGITYSGLSANDWVLTHDAARPCVKASDVAKLIDYCLKTDEGGILAVPVSDTIKQQNAAGKIGKTIPRDKLWAAQTPQCFKVGPLTKALSNTEAVVTDEASAMEASGFKPALIEGSSTNFKVTRPADLALARAVFRTRAAGDDI